MLPFADHSVERDLDYFCRGVREEIVHHLARFAVAAHPRVATSRARPAIRRDAAMIISGSVRQSGERLRVTAQLIDGASGCYIWSESVDATLDDLFAAQERVAEADRQAARARARRSALGARRRARPNENLAAHNLYLQGRYHLNQRTEEGLRKALDFFEKALVEDAQYALAHSGLADAYGLLAHYGVFGPGRGLDEGGVERGDGGDARRPLRPRRTRRSRT